MATTKWANTSMLDAALAWVRTNAVKMTITTASIDDSSSAPSYSKITSTAALIAPYAMASVNIASAVIADGAVSGRKLTIPQVASIAVDASGTAARVCLFNSSGNVITYITTCTSQVLTSGNTVTCPAYSIEIRDPA
jgi:hypothetical protein